jgi:hypothetical protein
MSTHFEQRLYPTVDAARAGGAFWAAPHEVSGDGMASVGGHVAGDDRDDFGVGVTSHRHIPNI